MGPQSAYLGLLRIEDYCFAVPSSALQQVILRPELTPLPGSGQMATGAFQFEGATVPVFDVAPLLTGRSAVPKPRPLVAILRHNNMMLGIETDDIRKVVQCEAEICTELVESPEGGKQAAVLFPRIFWDAELGGAVGIVDADVLFLTAGMRPARVLSAHAKVRIAVNAEILNLALFQVHGRRFGVDIRYVREALHAGKITPAQLSGSVLYGHHLTEDRQTPVIRLLDYLQIAPQGGAVEPHCGLVIGAGKSGEEVTLGFLIENVLGTTRVSATEVHRLDGAGMRLTHLYRGVLRTRELDHILILEPEALLCALGAPDSKAQRSSWGREISATQGKEADLKPASVEQQFVVYQSGSGSLASALQELEAVVALPAYFPLGQSGDAFLGVMPWRGHTVKLVDVAVLMGQQNLQAESSQDVLITRDEGPEGTTHYGFLVAHVESLTSAAMEKAPLLRRPAVDGLPGKRGDECFAGMIRVRKDGRTHNVAVVDLRQLARWVAAASASAEDGAQRFRR